MKTLRLDASFDALATDDACAAEGVAVHAAKGMPEMHASCAPAPVTPDSCDTTPGFEDRAA